VEPLLEKQEQQEQRLVKLLLALSVEQGPPGRWQRVQPLELLGLEPLQGMKRCRGE
jgi:hypothetical protein